MVLIMSLQKRTFHWIRLDSKLKDQQFCIIMLLIQQCLKLFVIILMKVEMDFIFSQYWWKTSSAIQQLILLFLMSLQKLPKFSLISFVNFKICRFQHYSLINSPYCLKWNLLHLTIILRHVSFKLNKWSQLDIWI